MSDILGLKGKVAIVTGSSKGWGRASARLLAERGALLVVNGTIEQDVLAVTKEIRNSGGQAVPIVEDVSTMKGAERIVQQAVDTYGKLDIMVNNAGGRFLGHQEAVRVTATLPEMTERQWDRVISVQLKGVFNCAKFAAIQMIKQGHGGRIINTAGGTAVRGMFGNGEHAASKAGVLAATLSWALELESHGITVNAVRAAVHSKGTIPMIEKIKQTKKEMNLPVPSTAREAGFFEPEEAAPLTVWLASECAKDVTGQFFGIDGPKITLWSYAQPKRVAFMFPHWTPELLAEVFKPAVQADFEKDYGKTSRPLHLMPYFGK
ncbi:MAG: SDR family NAD(P)-dependent oxidoreductase [Dehalococcoidia bacterium]|nr:SDR family NAD(P)-dependent oxidoreductase [Dehalococcoidia bacterium]